MTKLPTNGVLLNCWFLTEMMGMWRVAILDSRSRAARIRSQVSWHYQYRTRPTSTCTKLDAA